MDADIGVCKLAAFTTDQLSTFYPDTQIESKSQERALRDLTSVEATPYLRTSFREASDRGTLIRATNVKLPKDRRHCNRTSARTRFTIGNAQSRFRADITRSTIVDIQHYWIREKYSGRSQQWRAPAAVHSLCPSRRKVHPMGVHKYRSSNLSRVPGTRMTLYVSPFFI